MVQFGYFTLSDNNYADNRRGANEFVADILDEALYAEKVGLNSAWIGEHHFSTLGVLSCPALMSPRGPRRSGSHRLPRCCRCTSRSGSPSNGRPWTCSRAGEWISPPGAATTGANTR